MIKKSYEPGELPKKLEYTKLPKDAKEIIEEGDGAPIIRETKITVGKKGEYLTRFPKEIVENLPIEPEDRVRFTLKLPKPGRKENAQLIIELIKVKG